MPQLIGNVVHLAVEHLYASDPGQRVRAYATDHLVDAYQSELGSGSYATITAISDPRDEVMSAGADALDGLFELEDPKTITVDPTGLEVWVRAELFGAPIRGRIDRVYDASGAEVIADYKTGRVPTPRYTQKAFFGLWTYAAALAASDPDHRLADRIELLYLTGRERLARPVLREVALEHAKDLARIWRDINQSIEANRLTARKSALCNWCGFKPACPAFGAVPPIGSEDHNTLLVSLGLTRMDREAVSTAIERAPIPEAVEDEP